MRAPSFRRPYSTFGATTVPGLTWWQQLSPPTDPGNVNNVLAWALTLAMIALAWMERQRRADDAARHAEKDRQLAEKDKEIAELTAQLRDLTAEVKALSWDVRALGSERRQAGDD